MGWPTPRTRTGGPESAERKQELGRTRSGGGRPAICGHWSNAICVNGSDGKARRIEPGIEPLAHGVPGRVGLLRAYGNAIVPQVAAEFVMAFMETLYEREERFEVK